VLSGLLGLMDDTGHRVSNCESQLCGTAYGGIEESHLHCARAEELQRVLDYHGVEAVVEDDAISDTMVLTTLSLGIAEPLYGSLF
jgi:hypothetical protein